MMTKPNCPIIVLEEHYWDEELVKTYDAIDKGRAGLLADRLSDLGEGRLKAMDDAGVDIQVLSHNAPSTQKLPAETAVDITRRVNDRLAEICARHPTRYAGFAALPTAVPEAAADELERTVKDHGFKGAMLHGLANGMFLDDKKFWPIYQRAEQLDVPIYIHPSAPQADVARIYLSDHATAFPRILSAAWGFTMETATLALRMTMSGMFEQYPNLKIILGHLGETLPFLLWRVNNTLTPADQSKSFSFRDVFSNNFWITTSGNFSNPALLCCVMEMGIDRILFSVDWPYVEFREGTEWMKTVPLCDEDKEKVLSGNARRLLKM